MNYWIVIMQNISISFELVEKVQFSEFSHSHSPRENQDCLAQYLFQGLVSGEKVFVQGETFSSPVF